MPSPTRHRPSGPMRPQPGALPLLLGVLLLAGACLPAGAQSTWRWKDAQGQLHVSDRPPPADVPERNVLQRPAARGPATGSGAGTAANGSAATPTSTPAATGPGGNPATTATTAASAAGPAARPGAAAGSAPGTDAELEARRRKADQAARAQAQADEARLAQQRAENCQRARQALASLDSGQRLVRINERGERVFVDDATRAQEAQVARQVMASECR